ncbi:MAG: Sensory subunit of low CO2-induced protein complex, putative [uncultured Cytophagales bacterium]|uniref:Sensory subunit of low CO2-induced protein complex, putative n=1 Tax=uncultured Cytophagales bacterium TaxID=158755 RepID=A0A6J4JGL2_9SPHI|nr:MAG: Sensory subunit of low CO2-induced protein complex, putative [uncultured Cytophagales bacterium]
MKKYLQQFRASALLALLAPALFLTGCNDDDDTPAQPTIAEVVNTNADFSLLRAAVTKAGLGSALSSGNLTVFAPNNAAFQAAGLTEANINARSQAELAAVLQYHVINARTPAADLPEAVNTPVTTLSNGTVYVTKAGSNVSVNGARVVQADVAASNGVIHVIDRVLLPPLAGNIVQTAVANSDNFSYLVAAVQRANLAGTLSGPGPLTVFAPVNQAFIAAGFATIADIQAAEPAALARILTYHVVPSRVYSTNLVNGNVLTAQGSNVSINLGTGVQVTGLGNNGNAANVLLPNVTTTNGVIHAIDRVLLPAN